MMHPTGLFGGEVYKRWSIHIDDIPVVFDKKKGDDQGGEWYEQSLFN